MKIKDRNKDSTGEVKLKINGKCRKKINCETTVEAGAHEAQKQLDLAPDLSRKCGSRRGPPHTSPTVVWTGSTWKCGVGSTADIYETGDSKVNITSTNMLPCMVGAVAVEAGSVVSLMEEQCVRGAAVENEEAAGGPAGGPAGGSAGGRRGVQQGPRGGQGGRRGGVGGGRGGARGTDQGGDQGDGQGNKAGGGGKRNLALSDKRKTSLKIASWNKGGANQDLYMKRNEIRSLLLEEDIDCLGINEANLKKSADMEAVHIPGYVLKWDEGRENRVKQVARVVVYIKEELCFDIVPNLMQGDLMPEVWLKLGHAGTRRTLVGFVYREHTPVNTGDSSIKLQEARLQRWLKARETVWKGKEEVFVLGDINLDLSKSGGSGYYDKGRMLKMLVEELSGKGWVQLIKSSTHFWNRAGVAGESMIDHIWTNTPDKVGDSGQLETGVSDHHMIWVCRRSRKLVERARRTEKRSMKNFCLDDLEELCRQENWKYRETEPRTENMLEKRVKRLEEKINNILEQVAPMKTKKMKYRGRPKWMTPLLVERMKERVQSRKKANRSKKEDDEKDARRLRNEVAKEVRGAEREFMKTKLENLSKNSPDSWAAVGEFLGWRKPMSPTMLVEDGKMLTEDQDLAEAMLKQYIRKEEEVAQALGQARGDYLATSRRMTMGNKAVFNFRKVTLKEVEEQICKVDNKESFGNDNISYGFLKKMKTWIVEEIMEIINLSLEVRKYPTRWKIARVKPLYKGEGCDRHAPKSFRPVALLGAISRITEALLARQLDLYQEDHGLLHKGVHGFRRGRGTNTAMLETWEYALEKTQKGELVALDFLDISDGFGSMVHLCLLRKMEVQFGMGEESLEWLASYLEGWLQYVVVGASSSHVRKLTKGAPQGGGLSPNLFRSSTNDIPEAGLQHKKRTDRQEPQRPAMVRQDTGVVSRLLNSKEVLTTEEKLDQQLREEGTWDLESWRQERTGGEEDHNDRLLQKEKEEEGDVVTTIYADDTQSRTSAKTRQELERRNSRGLTEICRELKNLRMKVNEDKTTYMVLATRGRRERENLESQIEVCGEIVKSSKTGKCLGLLVSDDLMWCEQVDKVVNSCRRKQAGLWKCTSLLRKDQRKAKAEGIILSRLNYCLEVVSQGRKKDLEKLQSVQSASARWVLQTRKMDWSLSGGLRKLGWLSIAQQASYVSIKTALRVLQTGKPERLHDILTEEIEGVRSRKVVEENRFKKLLLTTRRAWSYRSLRWLDQLPESIRNMDMTKKSSKNELKKWIRHHVPVRGDRILWGSPLTGDMRRRRGVNLDGGPGGPGPAVSPVRRGRGQLRAGGEVRVRAGGGERCGGRAGGGERDGGRGRALGRQRTDVWRRAVGDAGMLKMRGWSRWRGLIEGEAILKRQWKRRQRVKVESSCGCGALSAPLLRAGIGPSHPGKGGELPARRTLGSTSGGKVEYLDVCNTLLRMSLMLEKACWREGGASRQAGHRGGVGRVRSGQG